jgi:hypothetical protein
MKKVTIKNLTGVQTHGAEMLDPTQWIADCIASNVWGLPERNLPVSANFDEADVVERFDIEMSPAIAEVVNDAGEIVQEAIPAVTVPMVKLRAEYTIEILDITAQVAQEKTNAEALAYLASTDWMVIREIDAGIVCPEDVKLARAEARSKIVRMD